METDKLVEAGNSGFIVNCSWCKEDFEIEGNEYMGSHWTYVCETCLDSDEFSEALFNAADFLL